MRGTARCPARSSSRGTMRRLSSGAGRKVRRATAARTANKRTTGRAVKKVTATATARRVVKKVTATATARKVSTKKIDLKTAVRRVIKKSSTSRILTRPATERSSQAPAAVANLKVVPATAEERPTLVPQKSSREECLQRYLPLVRYVVERVAAGIPRHVDHEDLISAGVLGLLNAYDKFDSGKGTKFETYAVWRIRGAVLDQLRALDWASRSTRRMGREMESCARTLDQRLGRTATDPEIARAMRMKLKEYYRLMDRVRGSVLVSLDETRRGEEGDTLGLAEMLEDPRTPDVLATIEQEETKSFLHSTLNRLPEQERLVMALYYYEQMTLREIGEALGISESRVSQIHTRAVERLRGRVQRALAS